VADHKEKQAAKDVGKRTGQDPIILAAVGSVLLAWYQYYVRGNKMHGLFIGLWPPTMLAFSNAVRINDISRKLEAKSSNLLNRLMQKQ
jgi:hypothetical protein